MEWLIILVLPVLAGAVAGRIARDKGRSPTLWRWLTALFCPLLIVLMLMPSKTGATYRAGLGMIGEALGAAAVILILVGVAIYAMSASDNSGNAAKPADPALAADCSRASEESRDLASSVTDLFSSSDIQLAMAQDNTQALCRKLADIMPKLRRVRAASAQCKLDNDPFSGMIGELLSAAASSCN